MRFHMCLNNIPAEDADWLRGEIGGSFLDQALGVIDIATDGQPPDAQGVDGAATEVACAALIANARREGGLIADHLAPGSPCGTAMRLAITLRTRCHERGTPAPSGPPSRRGTRPERPTTGPSRNAGPTSAHGCPPTEGT
eukprot:5624754-Pyramimonas_sp.AAC.1